MGLKVKGKVSKGEKKKFERPLPKEGARPARLVKIIDLGVHRRIFKGEEKKPVQMLGFEYDLVDDTFVFDEAKGPQPIRINTGYKYPLTVVLGQDGMPHEKTNLAKHLSALDPANKAKGDLSKLIGAPCIITVQYNKTGETTYANIADIGPVPDIEGFSITESPSELFIFDYDNPTKETWCALPEFIQEKIKESIHYTPEKFEYLDDSVEEDSPPF
jgi:hypothetical protein